MFSGNRTNSSTIHVIFKSTVIHLKNTLFTSIVKTCSLNHSVFIRLGAADALLNTGVLTVDSDFLTASLGLVV